MRLYLNDMLYAISYALDNVEREYRGIGLHHADRVAYIAVQMGRVYGLRTEELLHLAAAGVLHDNAFSEYIMRLDKLPSMIKHNGTPAEIAATRRPHCEIGERNVKVLPFYGRIKNAILYHHENADGSGAFGKLAGEVPLYARLLHFADTLDNKFILEEIDEGKYRAILRFLEENTGHLFTEETVHLFRAAFPAPPKGLLSAVRIRQLLQCDLPHLQKDYSDKDIEGLATVIARIIDYKSHFTCTHSLGIAQKAHTLGEFFGESPEICTKLYLAGALHDVGKLTIPTEILEKPDRLTPQEFAVMKTHAVASWNILRTIDGLDDVVEWACYHHEKLNGSGYPFGKTGKDLSFNARVLCCIDIYQALVEDRPYKEAMSHKEAMGILKEMAAGGLIDRHITEKIDKCFKFGGS